MPSCARAPWAVALTGALLALSSGCDCGATPIRPSPGCGVAPGAQPGRTASCAADADCADHHSCQAVASLDGARCCVLADRPCATEADCCPGQTCPSNRQTCLDKVDACRTDADCGPRGDRSCERYTDAHGTSQRCRLHACAPGGGCPAGQSCFQGECLAGLPCGGSCGPGEACVPTLDRCQAYAAPPRAGAACPVSCGPGFIGAFADGRNLWDACTLPAVACVCAELPPLQPGDLGRDSSLAAVPGDGVYVSSYEAVFGDLVVLSFDLDGGLRSARTVDGVPDAGVRYGPSGPRGGVAEPGPDVGRGTSIAAGGGRLYVSYQDVARGDLKVAVRDPGGGWTTHTVDGASGDVGRYTSLAVDASGRPGVAYFQRSADASFPLADCPLPRPSGPPERLTALRFARASSPTPTSASDWTVRTLACSTSGPPSTLAEVPVGVGLFPSLAFRGDQALIAATRRAPASADGGLPRGELVGVEVSATLAPGPLVVLDASGDTGYFPRLAVDPKTGQLGIAYHDGAARSLRFYLAPQLQAGVASELVDDGHDGVGSVSSVGTGSGLVFLPDGGALVAYQDATHGDLKVARRAGGWTVEGPVSSAGAVGFFADAVWSDGRVYASHARVGARSTAGGPRLDGVVRLEVLAP